MSSLAFSPWVSALEFKISYDSISRLFNSDLDGVGGPLHYASPELKRDFDVVSQALQTMRNRSIGVLSVEQREEIEATCLAEKRVGVVSIQSMHQEMARHWISTVDAMNTRGAEAGCMMIR